MYAVAAGLLSILKRLCHSQNGKILIRCNIRIVFYSFVAYCIMKNRGSFVNFYKKLLFLMPLIFQLALSHSPRERNNICFSLLIINMIKYGEIYIPRN